ncbi:hypothetical protein CAMGR0001_1017 [Campylobacter gracilis RM3268]|uniref:Uncharacterized protein n=1 Tax=Campylobacter gracilis RM3268 TaxID=553220 RepID=C8PGM2_9BACT|nr:hypothetical protein CAMGR0001_1017 [Campylobacter gracilis RM3268]
MDKILAEFKKRNISFVRFLNLAFKFILCRMKMNEDPRRTSAEAAPCIAHGAGKNRAVLAAEVRI